MQNSEHSNVWPTNQLPLTEPAVENDSTAELVRILDDTIAAYRRRIQEHSLLIARKKLAAAEHPTPPVTSADFNIRRAA